MSDTATMAGLDPATLGDLLRVVGSPGFDRLTEQLRRTGGCSQPIHLTGATKTIDRTTGTLLHHYSTDTEPGGRLRIACGNRRASRCPACAWTYAGDTYHLIRAGLTGDPDKGTPTTIRDHPRVFATLTAPSFGPVHNRPGTRLCRCGVRHAEDAPELGTPLDPETYDYAGAVLWNNHASDLWRYFTIYLRREIAKRAGLTQKAAREQSKVSFGKVAEYQKRGAVHFHAVIRFDGPEGPDTRPPAWATLDLLDDAIRAAAARVAVDVPANPEAGITDGWTLRWGTQLDVQPIGAFGNGEDLTEQAVASYVAKSPTRNASSATGPTCSASAATSPPNPAPTPPPSAHSARSAPTTAPPNNAPPSASPTPTTTPKPPRSRSRTGPTYAGNGHTPGESWLAANIHRDIQHNRETAREHRAELLSAEEEW
nr:replication initiator [Streptomyces sp. NRRL F-3218]